jgi:hypothetical protein
MVFCSGYMAPEYAIEGLFSVKSNVFSFGILLLEIVSGKKNRGFYYLDHSLNLIGHVSIRKSYIYLSLALSLSLYIYIYIYIWMNKFH